MTSDKFHYLESGKFSDFTIHCQQHVWKVHRVIISDGCEFFRRMCGGQFKEAVEQSANLLDDDPVIVARLLLFLYTGQYPDPYIQPWQDLGNGDYFKYRKQLSFLLGCNDDDTSIPPSSLYVNAAVHGLAEKYVVPELEKLSRVAYETAALRHWDLMDNDCIASMTAIYNTTNESDHLREYVIWWLTQRSLKKEPPSNSFGDIARSNADLAWDLISKSMAKQFVWCSLCSRYAALPSEVCNCGMTGICCKSGACGKWGKLRCSYCDRTGHCMSDQRQLLNARFKAES